MGDQTAIRRAQAVKVVGANSTGVETTPMDVDLLGQAKTVSAIGSGGVFSNLSVGTSAVEVRVGASRLTNRKLVMVHAVDADLYWGYSSSVTTANGMVIMKGQQVQWAADDTCQIWLIAAGASKNARINEAP